MLRRLLTCLALITGLAAIGAPVSVSAAQAMSQQATGGGSCVVESGKEQRCACQEQRQAQPSGRKRTTGCKPRKPVIVNLPPLYLGSDRALE